MWYPGLSEPYPISLRKYIEKDVTYYWSVMYVFWIYVFWMYVFWIYVFWMYVFWISYPFGCDEIYVCLLLYDVVEYLLSSEQNHVPNR